jgi:hypothetical protein
MEREDVSNEVHAGFARHVHVAQYEGKRLLGKLLPGLPCIRRQADGIPVRFEEIAQ